MMMAMYGRQFAWLLPTVFLLLSTSMWTSRVDAASNITNVTCFSSNECVNVPGRSVCLKPECISMNNPAVLGYCAQCNPCTLEEEGATEPQKHPLSLLVHHPEKHCYCKPTEYCESGAYISLTTKVNPQRGSCVEIDPKNSIYDSPCIQNLNSENLVFGYNHLVFCGLANYDPSGAVRVIEWQGRCWMGKCRFCGSEPIPGLPISLCPDGRSCLPNGRLEYAYVGSLSWPFWQYNPMIPLSGLVLLFAFLTFVSVLVYVTSWYCRNRRKMADQQEYHTVE